MTPEEGQLWHTPYREPELVLEVDDDFKFENGVVVRTLMLADARTHVRLIFTPIDDDFVPWSDETELREQL